MIIQTSGTKKNPSLRKPLKSNLHFEHNKFQYQCYLLCYCHYVTLLLLATKGCISNFRRGKCDKVPLEEKERYDKGRIFSLSSPAL